MPDHHHGVFAQTGQAPDDRLIIGKGTVTVEFMKVFKNGIHVVKRVRAVGMAGDQSRLPGRELPVDFRGLLRHFALKPRNFALVLRAVFLSVVFEFFDLCVDFTQRFFKFKENFLRHKVYPFVFGGKRGFPGQCNQYCTGV